LKLLTGQVKLKQNFYSFSTFYKYLADIWQTFGRHFNSVV
jgi:hypothetical protein